MATRRLENELLKKEMKFTDSFIIEAPKEKKLKPAETKPGYMTQHQNGSPIVAQLPNSKEQSLKN